VRHLRRGLRVWRHHSGEVAGAGECEDIFGGGGLPAFACKSRELESDPLVRWSLFTEQIGLSDANIIEFSSPVQKSE
jgi:hypothetical protein